MVEPCISALLQIEMDWNTAEHLLIKVFSCIIVRPMFVNTNRWESAGEPGIRALYWKDTCYIPWKIQLAPLLLNLGASLIFLAQNDLRASTTLSSSWRSSSAHACQNTCAVKKQNPTTVPTCPPSCANNSHRHSGNLSLHLLSTRWASDGAQAPHKFCFVLQV